MVIIITFRFDLGNGDTSNQDVRYKAKPYDRPQEQNIPMNQQ